MNRQIERIPTNGYKPGLEGIVAAETKLSQVDGKNGKLIIGGFALEELAPNAKFEEVVFLLWHGRLPEQGELDEFTASLAGVRHLPAATVELLRAAATTERTPMDALRMAAGTLDLDLPFACSDQVRARAILARLPTAVAAYQRLLCGDEVVAPDPTLGHAANFLYMRNGTQSTPAEVRALETYLNTVIEHGLNASTFAARVIIATQSDVVSAVVGAVGALKGPLHGGAPGPALDLVFEIGDVSQIDTVLRAKLESGARLMGFGHRVYKVYDPRARVLADAAEKLYGVSAFYDLAKSVEARSIALLEEYKPGRNLQTNVEFYTALLLHGLGLETQSFTPIFAMSRAAGWIAHCFEQQESGRLIRPASRYVGQAVDKWVPLSERGAFRFGART